MKKIINLSNCQSFLLVFLYIHISMKISDHLIVSALIGFLLERWPWNHSTLWVETFSDSQLCHQQIVRVAMILLVFTLIFTVFLNRINTQLYKSL